MKGRPKPKDRTLTTDQRAELMRQWWEHRLAAARSDPNAFMELCFKNDQDPNLAPFRQQPFHREWQAAWQRERITVLHGATGFGKTEQFIGHIIWRIGQNPRLRVVIVGKTAENAKKTLAKIKRQIETNAMVHAVFPELRPGAPWHGEKLRVAGAGIDTTTNTVEVYGVDGSPQGLRGDVIVLDDIIDFTNTMTELQRDRVTSWVDAVVQSRLTTHGQLHFLVNAWHPKDVAFTYASRPGVWHGHYPAKDANGKLLWPEFRDEAWLAFKQGTMSPAEFNRMYLCLPANDNDRLFKGEWFARARAQGLDIAPRDEIRHAFDKDWNLIDTTRTHLAGALFQQEMRVVVGLDLATGETEKKRKTDLTCFFVLGIDVMGRRHVLWVERGRWDAGETIRRMKHLERRYRPHKFVVENNGTQKFLLSFANEFNNFGATIEPYTTGSEKWSADIGIEAIGIELQASRWVIPNPTKNVSLSPDQQAAQDAIDEWASHLLDFSRVGHTPDDVMASWFAQRAAVSLGETVFMNLPRTEEHARAAADDSSWNAVTQFERATSNGPSVPALSDDPADAQPALPPHLRSLMESA